MPYLEQFLNLRPFGPNSGAWERCSWGLRLSCDVTFVTWWRLRPDLLPGFFVQWVIKIWGVESWVWVYLYGTCLTHTCICTCTCTHTHTHTHTLINSPSHTHKHTRKHSQMWWSFVNRWLLTWLPFRWQYWISWRHVWQNSRGITLR